MVPVKIQCGCGQKYAFEVEPVSGQMPWVVTCPICGTDGTSAANLAIAQTMPAQAPLALAGVSPLRVAAAPLVESPSAPPPVSAAPKRGGARLPGQIEPAQAKIEAKAKISWGDPPEEVVKYLMIQGFGREEAAATVKEMFDERAVTIRRNGFWKIIVGIGMVIVPAVTYFIFANMAIFPMKLFALTVMLGLWGVGKILKGIFMVLAPRSERGDVAEH